MVEKQEVQINKLEGNLKEQRISIFSWEEENRILITENRYLAADSKNKQNKIEELENEI